MHNDSDDTLINYNNLLYKKVGGRVERGDLVRLKSSGEIFTLGDRSEHTHNIWFSNDYRYRSIARWEFDKLEIIVIEESLRHKNNKKHA